MAAPSFMQWQLWQTAGWMMLHFLWVGGAIGLLAAAARSFLRTASPDHRYTSALGCFLALALSPGLIGAYLLLDRPPSAAPADASSATHPSIPGQLGELPGPTADRPVPEAEELAVPAAVAAGPHSDGEAASILATLSVAARYLPWLWLMGSPLTLLAMAMGLIGVERLKRQTILLSQGELPEMCRRLALSLGVARHVAIGVCERLATPILVGVARPLILLPPAVLACWSVEQVEMVLLHELAHVRRWDTLVNLLQRFVEALLFFHPAVWWVSAWMRLERELCCDQVVITRTGRPRAYAHVLAALALPAPTVRNAAVAMGEHNLVTRIRRILNLEDRTMKVSPKPLLLVAALPVAALILLCLYAQKSPLDAAIKLPAAEVSDELPTQPNKGEKHKDQDPTAPSSGALPKLPPGTLPPVALPADPLRAVDPAGTKKAASTVLKLAGEVEASERVDLYARVAGSVDKVHVDIGDRVKKGQALAELAVPELVAEYRQKQAGVEQVKAEVEAARRAAQASRAALDAVKIQVRDVEPGIKIAHENYLLRSAEASRMNKLVAEKTVDLATLNVVRNKLETAKAAMGAAETRLELAKANVEESLAKYAKLEADRKVSEAKLTVAEAELQRAAIMVQFAKITAPLDGVVTRRTVDAGSFAQSAERGKPEPLFVLARTDTVRVVIHVPDASVTLLDKGTRVTIRLDALKGREFAAKVSRIAGALDRSNRTLRAEIDLPNADGKIIPGMYGTVTLTLEK